MELILTRWDMEDLNKGRTVEATIWPDGVDARSTAGPLYVNVRLQKQKEEDELNEES